MELNDKQRRFCEEYVIDLSQTQAAIRAGYSPKTAYSSGNRLLSYVECKKYIEILQKDMRLRSGITADRVIEEIAKIAFSDINDVLDEGNTIRDITKLSNRVSATVSSVKVVETLGEVPTRRTEVKFYDKGAALDKLGRHLGIFEKDNKQQAAAKEYTMKLPDGSEIPL